MVRNGWHMNVRGGPGDLFAAMQLKCDPNYRLCDADYTSESDNTLSSESL